MIFYIYGGKKMELETLPYKNIDLKTKNPNLQKLI